MKRMTRTLVLVFGLVVLVTVGLHQFLAPAWFVRVDGDGWRAELPRLALPAERRADGPWTWEERSGAAAYRVGSRPLDGPSAAAVARAADALHPRPVERLDVPALEGRFLLSGGGKHWRATLVFPAGGRLFAADVDESRGNAAEPLLAVSRMAASLEAADGTPWVGADRGTLDAVVAPAVARHLVGMDAFLPLIVGFVLAGLAVSLVVVKLAGRLPGRAPGAPPPLLAEPDVALVVRRGRWQYRRTVGAAVLDADGLQVTSLGRVLLRVPRAELGTIRRVDLRRGRVAFEAERDGRVVRFEPADPGPWTHALVPGHLPGGRL